MSFHEEHDPLDECVVEVLKERISELKARVAELEAENKNIKHWLRELGYEAITGPISATPPCARNTP